MKIKQRSDSLRCTAVEEIAEKKVCWIWRLWILSKLNISRFFPAVTKFVTYLKCSSPVRIVSMLETCTCVRTDNLHVDSSWKSKTSTFYKHTSAIFFFTFKSSTSFMSSIDSSTLPSAPTKMNTQSFKIISCPITCKESQQASLNP